MGSRTILSLNKTYAPGPQAYDIPSRVRFIDCSKLELNRLLRDLAYQWVLE